MLGEQGNMRGLRVLVVEDEAVIAILFSEVLEGMGHHVCASAATEADAVSAAARYRPDLMIVDAHLRKGSGISAVAEILRWGFIPHIFVSGDSALSLSLGPGAIAIQKPFLETDLVLAIQRALDATPSETTQN
jgi:CheY-like chemotaxis protein